ncbi:MAG: glycosyltransferase family 4 protein [Flavobacteriales bacterium]|nr:glycosyltransferase family 4 protein [Flavobacteriales bacterium]
MRIGMILDKTFPPDPRVENEALALINSGHQVFLFCLTYDNEPDQNFKGIEVKRYHSNKLEYKLSALSYTFPFYRNKMSRKIALFLKENKIEIIHVHDMVIADAVFKANKNFKLQVVLDLHENRPEIMKSYPHLKKFPGNLLISLKAWKKKEEELVRMSDKTVVVTKEAKSELKERVGLADKKIVVVPNTVKSSFYQDFVLEPAILERYKDKFVIIYLGDTGLRRGLLSMIEALGILCKDDSIKNQIKLVIVGKNSTDEVLKSSVAALGLEKIVDFEGWKDEKLFPSYLKVAAIGISPLHRNIHHDTTYANKLFQYMSFALPVLVSEALAQKNLIDEVNSGLIHKEKDAIDLADKILTLYKDPVLSKKLGLNGKKFIEEKFYWEKVSDNLKDLYLEFKKS